MSVRVLVIEDDDEIAGFVAQGLREEGFSVDVVSDGIAAEHVWANGSWDLVILDLWLPGRDGLEVLRRRRRQGDATAVLILTARDAIEERVQGLDAEADDYLVKPFAFVEMLARCRALLRRRPQLGSLVLRYADVTLSLATQRAERAGRVLTLTAREQALLSYFLRHPGEVLSRTRIYEQVWGDACDVGSNTLEVHVMELRRKLEAVGPRLIHTVRGKGYTFESSPTDEGATG